MPFYEYECSACGHYLEAMQKVSDTPLRKCPSCRRQKLVRLISAPVFRLKGAGWYETDFKSEADRKRNLAEHPDKDTEKKAEEPAKADDKPKESTDSPAAAPPAPEAKTAKGAKSRTPQPAKKKAASGKSAGTAKRRAAAR